MVLLHFLLGIYCIAYSQEVIDDPALPHSKPFNPYIRLFGSTRSHTKRSQFESADNFYPWIELLKRGQKPTEKLPANIYRDLQNNANEEKRLNYFFHNLFFGNKGVSGILQTFRSGNAASMAARGQNVTGRTLPGFPTHQPAYTTYFSNSGVRRPLKAIRKALPRKILANNDLMLRSSNRSKDEKKNDLASVLAYKNNASNSRYNVSSTQNTVQNIKGTILIREVRELIILYTTPQTHKGATDERLMIILSTVFGFTLLFGIFSCILFCCKPKCCKGNEPRHHLPRIPSKKSSVVAESGVLQKRSDRGYSNQVLPVSSLTTPDILNEMERRKQLARISSHGSDFWRQQVKSLVNQRKIEYRSSQSQVSGIDSSFNISEVSSSISDIEERKKGAPFDRSSHQMSGTKKKRKKKRKKNGNAAIVLKT